MTRKICKTAGGVLLALLIIYLCTAISIVAYSTRTEDVKCDAAIVLGAAAGDYSVSEVYAQRLNHAARLYEGGKVKKIITTGGKAEGALFSDAHSAREYLLEKGIPKTDVLMEEKSRITLENMRYSKEVMEENGYSSAFIVSDPLHMKRAMMCAEKEKIEAHASPTDTSAYKRFRTKAPFLLREALFTILQAGYNVMK